MMLRKKRMKEKITEGEDGMREERDGDRHGEARD